VPLCAVDLSLENSDPTALSRHFRAFGVVSATDINWLLQQPG